jgi:hypothetical protein
MKSMSKSEMLITIKNIIKVLESGPSDATAAADKYSTDSTSKLAFEVGYLGGVIKTVLEELRELK